MAEEVIYDGEYLDPAWVHAHMVSQGVPEGASLAFVATAPRASFAARPRNLIHSAYKSGPNKGKPCLRDPKTGKAYPPDERPAPQGPSGPAPTDVETTRQAVAAAPHDVTAGLVHADALEEAGLTAVAAHHRKFAGHPFAGKTKEEIITELGAHNLQGINAPRDPWKLRESPPANADAIEQTLIAHMRDLEKQHSFSYPKVNDLYNATLAAHPGLALKDFQKVLVRARQRGRISLGSLNRPLSDLLTDPEHPEAAFPQGPYIVYHANLESDERGKRSSVGPGASTGLPTLDAALSPARPPAQRLRAILDHASLISAMQVAGLHHELISVLADKVTQIIADIPFDQRMSVMKTVTGMHHEPGRLVDAFLRALRNRGPVPDLHGQSRHTQETAKAAAVRALMAAKFDPQASGVFSSEEDAARWQGISQRDQSPYEKEQAELAPEHTAAELAGSIYAIIRSRQDALRHASESNRKALDEASRANTAGYQRLGELARNLPHDAAARAAWAFLLQHHNLFEGLDRGKIPTVTTRGDLAQAATSLAHLGERKAEEAGKGWLSRIFG